jgi:YbgC/YbaW family acyl-CoA thioester hydrolase
MSDKSNVSHNTDDYRHVQTYRVRYADLDTYRHVNNKAFLSYVEDARVHYLMDGAGFSHHQDDTNGVMVVHAGIDYLSQIQPFETVRVYTRTARIGGKSITLHHLIVAEPGHTPSSGSTSAPGATAAPRVAATAESAADNSPAGTAPGATPAPRVAATSTTVLASVDLKRNTSRPNTQEMIDHIRSYEKTPPE